MSNRIQIATLAAALLTSALGYASPPAKAVLPIKAARALVTDRVNELYGAREPGDPNIVKIKYRMQPHADQSPDPKFSGTITYDVGAPTRFKGNVSRILGLSFQQAVTLDTVTK
jgi:hypothetical protein